MGSDPDYAWDVGAMKTTPSGRALGTRNRDTMWTKEHYFSGRSDFFTCIEELLDELDNRREYILELRSSGGDFQMIVDIIGCRNVGDVLSAESMTRMGYLGVRLGLEIFPIER